MPNAKVLEEKKALVADLAEKLKNASSGVLVDYKGITVAADTKLRRDMRAAGVEYAVVKNTLLRFALTQVGYSSLDKHLTGTSAIAISSDPVAPAKILTEFVKKADKKTSTFSVKAGFVDGQVIDSEGVTALAELPPKEVLIAKVLGGFNAPISGFVNVLNGNIRGLAVALNAIAEQKSAQAGA